MNCFFIPKKLETTDFPICLVMHVRVDESEQQGDEHNITVLINVFFWSSLWKLFYQIIMIIIMFSTSFI